MKRKVLNGWYVQRLITGPKGFVTAYRHHDLFPFRIVRMGQNARNVGTKWRAFCDDTLLSPVQFKTAAEAAAYVDGLLPVLVPAILRCCFATVRCGASAHNARTLR